MSIYRTRNGDISLNSIKNSLTEILPNKSADTIERTKFEQSQNASIVKALNNVECPVKEKHVRNIILGTCYEKSALPFWYMSLKLQLYGNAIVCWKFNYVLHKLLREGHSSTLDDSYRFVATLDDLSKSWVHLKQSYGTMLFHYCNFLSFKVKFHKKNQLIPGNLIIEDKDLVTIVSNDVNNYFQMCCDFFDYADEIIALQNAVFITMDRSRSNSMTESGQCKLAPLVLCIQESNQLYDFCVKFLFKLHDNLPSEILEGHRARFLNMFKQLSKFYECCKNLQYFKNLITIPELPANPPNFRQKSEFNSYSKPEMIVIEQPQTESHLTNDEDSILVDFSDNHLLNSSSSSSSNNDTNSIQLQQLQQQQFAYSQQLLQEIERLRAELDRLTLESEFERRNLRERIKHLEDELMVTKTEMEQQKIKSQNLEEKLKIMNENEKAKVDVENLEKKAVSSEEKFNKMKELYTKLKDQHVTLLRQEADVRKHQLSLTEACEHANKMKKELEKRLEEAIDEKTKCESIIQAKSTELQSFKSENEKNQATQISSNQINQEQIKQLKDQVKTIETELNESNRKIIEIEASKKGLQDKCTSLILNSTSLESDLNKYKSNSNDLTLKLNESNAQKELAEKNFIVNLNKLRELIFVSTNKHCISSIKNALNLFEDPVLLNCKSGAEYLLNKMQAFSDSFNEMVRLYKQFTKTNETNDETDFIQLLNHLNTFSNFITDCVINGKITSLTAADFQQGEVLAENCRNFGQTSISLLEKLENKGDLDTENEKKINDLSDKIIKNLYELLPKVHDINKQEIGDLIDKEMHNTSEAIEAAVARLEALISKSREQDTGVKLEVNDKILDNCTALMKTIKILIIKAKELQKEIVAQGRGASTVKEFYAKNHKWTEGLVTAAKLVGLSANVLIEKADKLVNGNGKLEEIIVCSNEIAASTAQLVVSSNVKANRESHNRIALIEAKNNVSSATAGLVAAAKSCSQIIDDKSAMDFTNLSLHQTKRLEMEAQVKVLELEKQLENEKKKLYQLRKQHYQLAGEN